MRKFALTYLFILLAVSIVTWIIWARYDYPFAGIDDANIFFVYAKHLANGYGFVYNIGGERVEGFSSLLWTLLCAAVFSVSAKPELTLLVINIVIISVGVTVAVTYIRSALVSQTDSPYAQWLWPLIFIVLLITSASYLLWNTITLMENTLWSTLLILATIMVIQKDISSRVIQFVFIPIAVLLLLTRPESYLWVSVFSGILLVRKTLANGFAQALKEMVPVFVVIVGTVIVLTVFRRLYFGYPLPNTYYAKLSPSLAHNVLRGTVYFATYFISNPVVSICILAAILTGMHAILTLVQKNFTDDGMIFLPILAGVGLLAPIVTGGDHFSSFRFFQGVYPILLLCLLYFVKTVLPQYIQLKPNPDTHRRSQRIFTSSLTLLFIVISIFYQMADWLRSDEVSEMSNEFEIASRGRVTGQFARETFAALPQLPSIGVVRAGGIKYTYTGEVIDLMGLNNLAMAHNGGKRLGEKNHAAFEKSTFYQLEPDLLSAEIVSNRDWQYQAADLKKSWDNTVPLKGLYNDAAFLQLYIYAKVIKKESETDKALVGWFQKDFLEELQSSDFFVIEKYQYPASGTGHYKFVIESTSHR